jgi:uncharacterized protein (TIGR00288 family)
MDLLGRFRESETRVGLFVDGPNMLRDEFDVDLDEVRTIGESYGPLAVTRLYLDENASPGLIQAGEARGFEVVTTSGDVDVRLAVDATEAVATDRIDVLMIGSRDTDFKPAIEVAARSGVTTVALAPGEHGRSDALQNAADDALSLNADV